MNRRLLACLLPVFWSGLAPIAHAAAPTQPHDRLEALAREFVEEGARAFPMRATEEGIAGHDAELEAPSEAARAAWIARLRTWKHRLDATVREAGPAMGLVDRDDARLLGAELDRELDGLLVRAHDRKDFALPAVTLTEALFTQFLNLPVAGRDGATSADVDRAWDDIVARMERGPAYIAAGQRLVTHPGHLFGVVGSQSLAGVPDFIGGALAAAAKDQLAARPKAWERFEHARDALLATIAATRATIDAHVGQWPENFAIGRNAYRQMLRDEALLPYDEHDIEAMGRDALAHGWAEEAWLVDAAHERGVAFGPASGGGMAPGGPALVDYYRARIGELTAFMRQHDIVTLPDWLGEMRIVETPAFLQPVSPGASMNPPRRFAASTTGFYFITPPTSLEEAAKRLDMNEDFDRDRIWSTGAHEAMPGHFFQLSIARRHPDYIRKIQDSSEFSEGWAFYGEEMFVRLGMYGDDLDARLFTARWERVRGARAIVDPKLACGDWTLDQAVAFFEAQSGFTHEASVAAVSGIAAQPGYVISYVVGRAQLEDIQGQYLRAAGAQASLHDFHDRLLSYGTTPFAIVGPELLQDLDKPASAVRAAANF